MPEMEVSPLKQFATDVVRKLVDRGHRAVFAGGCVRDMLRGQEPKDFDVATSALPEQVMALFPRTIPVGVAFGVVRVLSRGPDPLCIEVATFRIDGAYSDERHPDRVAFSTEIEDVKRRDFTINGLLFDPLKNELLDYVGGQADLERRVIRAIGDPQKRFAEDHLRLLRAIRFAARLDFEIDANTFGAIKDCAGNIHGVSAERVRDELAQMLTGPHPRRAFELLKKAGLLRRILPEIDALQGVAQPEQFHPEGDVWEHTLMLLGQLENAPLPLALGALLHDVGKPRTVGRTPERYTFYGHEHVGARMAHVIAKRLKLSVAERERIVWLVEKHQYLADAKQLRPSKLKTILVDPGIRELLALHRADAVATGRSTEQVDYCDFLLSLWTEADLSPPPLLTGHDLTRHGYTPGPKFKVWLDAVREAQLDGAMTTPEQAWALVHQLANIPDAV